MSNQPDEQTQIRMVYACSKACGKRIFAQHRIRMTHLMTTDFDVAKGETPIADELVADVSDRMRPRLRVQPAR